ncbi:MAG TPA: ATP-binding protein [Chryseosolibacter sp.]|nr:ATP-binding protein [Chryseosolibacter sp.]
MNIVTNSEALNAMQTVLDISEHAIVTVSSEGLIVGWNQAARDTLGYSSSEVIGEPAIILLRDKSAPGGSAAAGSLSNSSEWRCKDGSFVKVSARMIPVQDARFGGAYVIAKFSVDSAYAQGRIVQLTKQLEALSYSVSHDLRAPVRSILNYANILHEEYLDKLDDDGKKVLSIITRNSEKLMQLIEDLLALAKVWKHELTIGPVDMNMLVNTILAEQLTRAGSGTVEIKTGPLHESRGDKKLLREVWANLISNALKYSEKKDKRIIEIGSSAQGRVVTYFIKDNGAGFDMQYAGKLFTPFQRLHGQHEFDGNGIGLAIVQQIINRHLGRVWADAKVNQGATFYFSLPA